MTKRNPKDYVGLLRSELTNHYQTQKSLAKKKVAQGTAANRITEFLKTNIFGWIYHYLKSRLFSKKHPFMDYTNASSNGVFEMHSEKSNSKIKIVLAADWASDTNESDYIGELMGKENPDYSIHLGDTYFVGAPPEIKSNFTDSGNSWPRGSSGTLALPGNHEFYSNGNPFYDYLLPAMYVKTKKGQITQEASFFCLQNEYWRIIGLDTGYYSVGKLIIEFFKHPDAHLDDKQIDWIKKELKLESDNRGLIFLSHHQYCSAFEEAYVKAAEKLKEIIGDERAVIWIWGHEHRFAVYGKYQSTNGIKAYGRCIGHGGMPVEIGKINWLGKEKITRPTQSKAKDNHLVFYDCRKKGTSIGKTFIGRNGFAVMSLNNNQLIIEYKDEKDCLFTEHWTIDLTTGILTGKVGSMPNKELTLVAVSFDEAVK